MFAKSEALDLICINEHWCSSDNIQLMNIPGYKIFSSYTRNGQVRGGSMIYVRDDMNAQVIDCENVAQDVDYECCADNLG